MFNTFIACKQELTEGKGITRNVRHVGQSSNPGFT